VPISALHWYVQVTKTGSFPVPCVHYFCECSSSLERKKNTLVRSGCSNSYPLLAVST
jgi:hypothetical protein